MRILYIHLAYIYNPDIINYMGKIFKSDFFEIYVFSRDHLPSHCHIYFPKKSNQKGFLKIELNDELEVLDLNNISAKDIKKIEAFLTEDRISILKEKWEEFHE